jgi:threonine aldolase
MNFASDNWAGASPRVREALAEACGGIAPAYGGDDDTAALREKLCDLFERDVAVFPTATGTATNSLAIAALCPPFGAVLAHEEAHIVGEEYGAPEFFSQGARLIGLPGPGGKLVPRAIDEAMDRLASAGGRQPVPHVLSLTQATECGTAYCVEEVDALARTARKHGMAVHMDGARFANAVASLGRSPAEVTWKAGVDALSFGGTKNGAMMAEAAVFFDKARADEFDWRRRRGGHVVSKTRLISSQFLALLSDDHWLDLASHANAMAARLSDGIARAGHRIPWPVQANEVFPVLPEEVIGRLKEAGARFYEWPSSSLAPEDRCAPGNVMVRLVASFATTPAEVDSFLSVLG